MTYRQNVNPQDIGNKVGAITMTLQSGTTDVPENVQSINGQMLSLMRAYQPTSLNYVSLQTDVNGYLQTVGGAAAAGTTLVSLSSGTQTIGTVLLGTSTGMTGVAGMTTGDGNIYDARQTRALTSADSVSLSSGTKTLGTLSSGTQVIGSIAQGSGGSSAAPWYTANTSLGTTGVIGSVALLAGSTANSIGSVALVAGTSANTIGAVAVTSGVVLGAGSSANTLGSVALAAGTTANSIGSVALLAAGSSIGSVQQGLGSSANAWFVQSIAYSSASLARTSVNTTQDISVIAANASRKALVVANLSTLQTVGLGLSTGTVTTGMTNVNLFLGPSSQVAFGINGNYPLFTGPIRGINLTSTTVAGGVGVMEFT